jgi:hypothetical protein
MTKQALTPNSPRGRFEFVLKTYWGRRVAVPEGMGMYGSLDPIVLDCLRISANLIGMDNDFNFIPNGIDHETGSLAMSLRFDDRQSMRILARLDADLAISSAALAKASKRPDSPTEMLARLGQPYDDDLSWDQEQVALAAIVLSVVKLPDSNPLDFLIPWVARELVKLGKAVLKNTKREHTEEDDSEHPDWEDYEQAVKELLDKAPAIALWMKETRVDTGRVDLPTALEAIKTYKFKTSNVEQGAVVYRFADDWTAQELRTDTSLTQEGKGMQNCVGGYDKEVLGGHVRIYSIRDEKGLPHVTMELRRPPLAVWDKAGVRDMLPEVFCSSPDRLAWHFAQVLGKQNTKPVEEYRARAREFIANVFDKEGVGWVLAGGPVGEARLRDRHFRAIDFYRMAVEVNHLEADAFARADFSGSNLQASRFDSLDLSGAKFDGVDLSRATFNSCLLIDASFVAANARNADFRKSDCTMANFREAHLRGANFIKSIIDLADFSGADLTDIDLTSSTGRPRKLGG